MIIEQKIRVTIMLIFITYFNTNFIKYLFLTTAN